MRDDELIAALKGFSDPDEAICYGCGHEHACNSRGCAVIREVITRLEGKSPWVSVDTRMPRERELVLVCRPSGAVEQGYFANGWWRLAYDVTRRVTHWMPMPEAPKGGA